MEPGRLGGRRRPRGLAAVLAVLVVTGALLVGCASEPATTSTPVSLLPPATVRSDQAGSAEAAAPSTSTTDPGEAPATTPPLGTFTGDAFFDPGDSPPGAPGDILKSRTIELGLEGARAWQILYWSRTAQDLPVAVSATVMASTERATAPRPVFAYAHPTAGLADHCAPSVQIAEGSGIELQVFPFILQQGWIVVETDYQGLGTPGDHPYLVGQSEGRNVLDSIRAAQRMDGTGATPASPALVWGHSQGGGAAAFSAELQPTYAPEVDLIGAIAGAPAAELQATGFGTDNPSYDGFIPMAVAGFRAGYPQLAEDDELMTARGRAALREVSTTCVIEALAEFRDQDVSDLFEPGTFDRPAWKAALAANQAGQLATDVPIFLYHGAKDDLIPPEVSAALLVRYCANGVTAYRKVYRDADHTSVIATALADIAVYAQDRLAGLPAPSSCP